MLGTSANARDWRIRRVRGARMRVECRLKAGGRVRGLAAGLALAAGSRCGRVALAARVDGSPLLGNPVKCPPCADEAAVAMIARMADDLRHRIAVAIVRARRGRGWSQRRLAAEARVSQSTVARAELGDGGSVEALERLLRAAGARASAQAPPSAEPGRPDLAHRVGVGTLRRLFTRAGMLVATEQPVVDGSVRGWIDLLAFDEGLCRLVLVEFKSELLDLGGTERQVERYARSVLQPARALGWRPREIVVSLVVLATEDADAFVATNRAELAAAFPSRGRAAIRAMLDGGPIGGRALVALDPLRVGRHALTSFRVDGRRQRFRFVHASDARRLLEERDHRRRGRRS